MRGRFTTEELRDPSETHQKYERTVAHKHRRNNIIIDLKESIIDFQGDLVLESIFVSTNFTCHFPLSVLRLV